MPPIEDAAGRPRLVDDLRTELARQQAQARSRDLARVAVSQLDVDPERALLLGLEANAAAITFESRDALQRAVSASRLRWVFGRPGEAGIRHAYFAQDSRHIFTADRDCVLRWWDLEARKEIAALNCCDGILDGFQPSPARDRALVTALNNRSGKFERIVVDLSERRAVASIDDETLTQDNVSTVTGFFSHDGRRLAINRDGADLSLWDATSGARLYAAADVGRCHGLDQEGRRALLMRADGSVAVLHPDGDGRAMTLNLSNEKATAAFSELLAGPMPFSADGTRVTAGTDDRVACVWDARDGRLLHVLGGECPCHRTVAGFTPSGRFIVVQLYDRVTTEFWDADTGTMQCRLPSSSAFHVPLRFLTYSPQPGTPEYAVVGMGASHYSWPLPANVVSEWDVTTGAVRSQFRLPVRQSFQRCFAADGTACHWGQRTEQDDISPDSAWVSRLEDGVARVFARVETTDPPATSSEYGCGYTADRQIRYTAEGLTLVDSLTNRGLAALGTNDRYLFSPDGRHLVAVPQVGNQPVVRVWHARTGALRFTIDAYSQPITTMQFQPGQALLLIGSRDHTVRLWSLETGLEAARATIDAPDEPSYEAASTSDGTKIAFATSGRLHVWHVDRGEIVHAPTTLYARDPRFSADGGWLLAADEDVVRVWETTTMKVIGEFPWHFAAVMSGDLSPDTKLAATYGLDNRVRLWEAPGGREITHWEVHAQDLRRPLRFAEDGGSLYSPDGRRLLVHVEQLIALAKTRVFRELGPEERRLFLGERET